MIRAVAKTMPLYLHDGFNLNGMTSWVTGHADKWQPIIVDTHVYFVFNEAQKSTPITQITQQINSSKKSSLSSNNKQLNGNLIVGEMGCANSDGQNVSNMDSALKAYCEAQVNVYSSSTAGWIFWALKMADCTEGSGDGWCFLGSAGKYLPKTFVAPSGQISSGGVTITPGSGPSNGSGSNSTSTSGSDSGSDDGSSGDDGDSGSGDDSLSSASSSSTSTKTASASSSSSTGSCSANKSNTKKRSNRRSLSARAADDSANERRRHHARALQMKRQIADDQGYTQGHIASGVFARAGRQLGMQHAYVKARMEHLGIDEDLYEHFARGFDEGHQEGVRNWLMARK